MENPNVDIIEDNNNLRFIDNQTNCKVLYNTSNIMSYNLVHFSCGNRGKGQGLKLLYDSLKYIQTKIPPRKRPFRIDLSVVPSSSDDSNNDFDKLKKYYEQIGFKEDEYANNLGHDNRMFATLDQLVINIKNILEQKAGNMKSKNKCKNKSKNKNKNKYQLKRNKINKTKRKNL